MATLLEREIGEQDVFGSQISPVMPEHFTVRNTARAVVVNIMGNVALIYASRRRVHHLVGGGMKNGEDPVAALRREALEEAGCSLEVIEPLGVIKELRPATEQLYVSHCYVAQAKEVHRPHYTFSERLQGCKLVWAQDIPEAMNLLAADKPWDYRAHFVSFRDQLLLETARNLLKHF